MRRHAISNRFPSFITFAPRACAALLTIAACSHSVRAQNADGGYAPLPNGPVLAIAVQPDGKALLGGDFTQAQAAPSATSTRAV